MQTPNPIPAPAGDGRLSRKNPSDADNWKHKAVNGVHWFTVLVITLIAALLIHSEANKTILVIESISPPILAEKPADEPQDIKIGGTGDKVVKGEASYYDYYLKDQNWSSIGHYVCATRFFNRYSILEITNLENDKSVYCFVTDYGPDGEIWPDRVIDLSSTAFKAIQDLKLGTIKEVSVRKVTP